MGKIGESLLFVALGIAVVGLFMFFPSLRSTGNVIADYEYKASIGDAIDYIMEVNVPENGIDSTTPLIVSLSKDGKIIDSKVISIEEFVKLSDNTQTLEGEVIPEGVYSSEARKIINYKFSEQGEYELYFAIFKLDIMRTIKITVK